MADYAHDADFGRFNRNQAESNRRIRTRRPLNDQVPVLGWHIEGEITATRVFGPYPLRVHVDVPEHKQLLGFDAWLEGGDSVTINWQAYTLGVGTVDLVAEHVINSGITDNEVIMPEPFIVSGGGEEGVPSKSWIRPVYVEAGAYVPPLCLYMIVQTVPI